MKVLVCGSRGWADEYAVIARLERLADPVELIHGAAPGADSMAAKYGDTRGWRVQPFYADWASDGKRAGVLRNLAMLDEGPDLVIAFHLADSPGTKHTITEARKRGIPVEVIREGPAKPVDDVNVCLECGMVWSEPCNCPLNGADSPTVSAVTLANIVNREWSRGVLSSESLQELAALNGEDE